MSAFRQPWPLAIVLLCALAGFAAGANQIGANARSGGYWQVDDIRAGMRGYGRTVMKGTHIENFDAEVLGVLKNTSPGRDMVLCRLSGLNLEKTGVIAGMSGSPIYLEGKLLGAVAFAWAFGKEPIAGVTPFSQMRGYVESYERRDLVQKLTAKRIQLPASVHVGGHDYDAVNVAQSPTAPLSGPEGAWLVPLQTPLVGTGFSEHSLELLGERLGGAGCVPVQGGGAAARIVSEARDVPLQPGSPLAVALITGDFDLSGIGTVTQIDGDRVYGWGHPFYSLGECEFPLMTGYIHAVYPRQSVSFKIGSPLRTVGVINADVSTGIAGWLRRKTDLMPVRMTIVREPEALTKTFQVQVVRQRSLVAALVYAALTNSVDMEGELPEELTAELTARIDIDGHAPVVIQDTFSGSSYSGHRAPQALYNQIASVVNLLAYNTYQPVRIKRIDCETRILPGRRTADIEAVELNSDTYSPGETLRGIVFVRPYKGLRQRLPVSLKLPADLPEGPYVANVCDDLSNARMELRDNPYLNNPENLEQVFEALKVQTSVRRTNLALRVPVNAAGVALEGHALPTLPPSAVLILGSTRRTGAQAIGGALVSKQNTDWVVQGSESVHFTVTKNKRLTADP